MQFKRLIAFILLSMLCGSIYAQWSIGSQPGAATLTNQKADGKWQFWSMGKDIVKVTYTPTNYTKTQQLSDAIMTAPQNAPVTSIKNHVKGFGNIIVADNKRGFDILIDGKKLLTDLTPLKEGVSNGFSFNLSKNEMIFGGGERALPLNRRGYRFDLYNRPDYGYGVGAQNLNYGLPFFVSSNGYGIFFDNPSKGFADIAKTNANRMNVGFESGELSFYLIKGSSPEEILKRYTSMIGTQPLPARWVFGNFMSRFGYRSEEQVRDIKAKMKEAKIPMDAIIIDLFWFGDSIQNYVGNLSWVNKKAWKDPKKMIADFKADSINTILVTEPYIVKNSLNYEESVPYLATDSLGKTYTLPYFYFGKGGLIDLFRKDARDWFWSKYKPQMDLGVSGWWGDLGEPEHHPEDVYHNLKDLGYKDRLYSANEVHNIFGHYWNKMLYEKFDKEYPETRLFNLNRSGYANSARYIIFPWTGDVGRNWSGYRAQLPLMITMSMSNVPYTHSDAGGFTFAERDNELYVRWIQMAAFSPILRPHSTALDGYPTDQPNYPSEAALFPEPYKDIARQYIQMRYDLLPYNYTLGYETMALGTPLVRPLFFSSFDDADAIKAEDQYMWGNSLLVAPVLDSGAVSRKLYLPKGSEWYNYQNPSQKFAGGQWINQPVTLDYMPIFVKGGAFIPTAPWLLNTKQYNPANINVNYYMSKQPSTYTLFDDDGTTNKSWEQNQFELVKFEANGKGSIVISSNGGSYAGKPEVRNIDLMIVGIDSEPENVSINGVSVNAHFDASKHTLNIPVAFNGTTAVIKY